MKQILAALHSGYSSIVDPEWSENNTTYGNACYGFKGTQIGPLLVLVCPCFRGKCNCHMQNAKLCLFCAVLVNFLPKNVIVSFSFFFFEIKFQNGAHLKNKVIFDLLFTFFRHQGKDTNISPTCISHLHAYTYFAHPLDFFTLPSLQKLRIYYVWFLFGMPPGVDSFSRHFGAINK